MPEIEKTIVSEEGPKIKVQRPGKNARVFPWQTAVYGFRDLEEGDTQEVFELIVFEGTKRYSYFINLEELQVGEVSDFANIEDALVAMKNAFVNAYNPIR